MTGPPYIRFAAGVAVRSDSGYAIGAICILASTARRLDADVKQRLDHLAAQAAARLEALSLWKRCG